MLELLFPIPTLVSTTVVNPFFWKSSTIVERHIEPARVARRFYTPLPNSSTTPLEVKPSIDNRSVILNRLRTFKGWEKNWDGEGAAAPNLAAIETASNFLSLWSPKKTKPEVALTHDGLPMFVIASRRLFGEIIVNGDDTVDYFFEPLSEEPIGEESVQYRSEAMLNILKELT